jgi:hypothetical protein
LSSIPSSHRQGKSAGWIQALGTPVSLWPERVRIAAALGAMVLCATVAYFSIQPAFIFAVPDADNYQRLSIGDTSRMMQPFASRQMGALVVHALMRGLHISSYAAWYLEAEIAGAALLAVVYGLMAKTAVPRWMLLALVVVPFWSGQMQYLVMPDLWYSGLLAIMFLLMARRQMLSAALMMFPLMFSRESTTLTLLCFLVAAWSSLRWRDRIAAVLSAGAGTLLVGHLARNSGANVEHLPEMVYILAKVPWNFVRNVIGFEPWSNVNPELCNVPRWSVPLAIGPLYLPLCHQRAARSLAGRHDAVRSAAAAGRVPMVAPPAICGAQPTAALYAVIWCGIVFAGADAGQLDSPSGGIWLAAVPRRAAAAVQ